MKKIVCLFILAAMVCVTAVAQTQYISIKRLEKEDRKASLAGMGGFLIYSKRSDLVIRLTNVKTPIIERHGIGEDGLYEYSIKVAPEETDHPKLEISKRGDVYSVPEVLKLKPDYYQAYLIEEVENPIRLEDQTRPQDAILDAKLAEVEIETTIQDLQVVYSDSLHATMETKLKEGDNSISVISIKIPIANLKNVEARLAGAQKKCDELYDKMLNNKTSKEEEQEYDRLNEEEIPALKSLLTEMKTIEVFAQGTNRLPISLEGISPRSKFRYGVLLLVKPEYVTEYDARLAEGVRQWNNRNYENAKGEFLKALAAKDAPEDKSLVQANIAECDSCIRYFRAADYALSRMAELKEKGTATQSKVQEYASAAITFITNLNNYNPCEFYSNILAKLEAMVENMPLVVKFTVMQWIDDGAGLRQGGGRAQVELWANEGFSHPSPKEYQSERRFKKHVGDDVFCKKLGETGADGTLVVNFDRKALPKGIFFHAEGDNTIKYIRMQDIIRNSKDDYQMRQFRTSL